MVVGTERRYVDHPAPGIGLMVLYVLILVAMVASLPSMLHSFSRQVSPLAFLLGPGVMLLVLAILCFYLWPFYSTYYTLSSTGVQVAYGPWKRHYPWSDFTAAFWQKGLFATRIGWPSVTPCVRLWDGILLKRKSKGFGLYLTPNDSRAFLGKISELAPDLTAETIL